MKFIAVLVGVVLLLLGLVAYTVIPNIHTIPIESTLPVTGPVKIVVSPNVASETQQNITIIPGKSNEMTVNLTVRTGSGDPSSIQFKLFNSSELGNCMRDTNPTGCLVDQNISNQTVRVPLNASATYYFGFYNRDSSNSKTVTMSASLLASSTNKIIARDGQANYAGLALGGLGVLIVLYGLAAKTVIPWE